MFKFCYELQTVDATGWKTSNVTDMMGVFYFCTGLEEINGIGNWNTAKATTMQALFHDCTSLTSLDVGNFKTGNVTSMGWMFRNCHSLPAVDVANWDISKVTTFYEMFNYNGKTMQLEYVDLSAFDTSSLTETYAMFNGCPKLTTVYVGDGWDMSKVTSSGAMFGSCSSLVGANGTTTKGNPSDVTYARVDTPAVVDAEGNVITEAVPGYLTYKAAPEAP